MAQLMENLQVGKKQALADLIANVEAAQTPFTSMAAKRTRPGNVDVEWQVKQYRRRGYRGVRDGQDAKEFHYNGREKLYSVFGFDRLYRGQVCRGEVAEAFARQGERGAGYPRGRGGGGVRGRGGGRAADVAECGGRAAGV
jgi:hypothetical protein